MCDWVRRNWRVLAAIPVGLSPILFGFLTLTLRIPGLEEHSSLIAMVAGLITLPILILWLAKESSGTKDIRSVQD